jgi:hypothetical protein
MATTPLSSPLTGIGVNASSVVPLPSSPSPLSPQHFTPPAAVSAQVKLPPAATAVTPRVKVIVAVLANESCASKFAGEVIGQSWLRAETGISSNNPQPNANDITRFVTILLEIMILSPLSSGGRTHKHKGRPEIGM